MKLSILFFLAAFFSLSAQVTLPYTNNFDNADSEDQWSHYAVTGTDNWQRGVATGSLFPDNLSWQTNLTGTPAANSNMALQTPSFDLTNANLPYVLSFKYRANISSGNFYLDYSTDNGSTWLLLNPNTTLKKRWQTSTGFTANNTANFVTSALNLSFLQGNSNVKFRFRLKTNVSVSGFGWIIDDFRIGSEDFNLYASAVNSNDISASCTAITVKSTVNFDNPYSTYYTTTTKYYLSTDTVLDAGDTYLAEWSSGFSNTLSDYSIDLTLPSSPPLSPGQYFIVFEHDANHTLTEVSEEDNFGYSPLILRPVMNLPYSNDFEQDDENWKTGQDISSTIEMKWERSLGRRHHIEKSHSGSNAWHTSKSINPHPEYTFQWVETPYFNLAATPGTKTINFWYKCDYPNGADYYDNRYTVEYSINCSPTWTSLGTLPANASDEWENYSIYLSAEIGASNSVKFRITYRPNYLLPEGIIFDDFYIGPVRPDISVEKIYSNKRYTNANTPSDVLKFEVANGGDTSLATTTVARMYWSDDAVLDGSDILLGDKTINTIPFLGKVWVQFNYTKPTAAAGNYYIIYVLDANNQANESRENNNTGVIPIEQLAVYPFPYYNDFEMDANNWTHEATLGQDDWQYTVPDGPLFHEAFSGTKAWTNRAATITSPLSRCHLYTPAFNLFGSVKPVLEFDMKLDNFDAVSTIMALNMSYSTDNGATWALLNPINQSYSKWNQVLEYDRDTGLDIDSYILQSRRLFAFQEPAFANLDAYNSRDVDRATKYLLDISQLKNETNIRFRFNQTTMYTAENTRILEGAMIDNFKISEGQIDLNVPYTKNLTLSSLATKVNFSLDVKNSGNYISNASNIKFYLSSDTVYDAGDVALGTSELPQIRPDFKNNLILQYALPANWSNSYNHIVYAIDDTNANQESDETNNTGYFTLGQSGITTFPYHEDFEALAINGWTGYSYTFASSGVLSKYRVTNRIAPTEENDFYEKTYNGIFMTEKVPYGSWQDFLTPMYYMQSPAFDFTNYTGTEPLAMAFDFMCVGSLVENGGNMEYSINGGASWTLITTSNGASVNWYPSSIILTDFNQPGWYGSSGQIKTAKMNIAFLQNQPNVLFRFKYYSNYAPSGGQAPFGFRLDNFTVGAESAVNALSCIESVPYTMNYNNVENTCWEFGASAQQLLFLNRSVEDDIAWQVAANFAGIANNASAKIDMVGHGNTAGVWMISPKFNMISGNKLKFNIALNALGTINSGTLDADDKIELRYTADNGQTWMTLKTWNSGSVISNEGQLEVITAIPQTGLVRFAFWATNGSVNSNSDAAFYVDDFALFTGSLSTENYENWNVGVYPNPVRNMCRIASSKETIDTVAMYSVSGQLIEVFTCNQKNVAIDLSSYANGIYFARIHAADKIKTIKIVKE